LLIGGPNRVRPGSNTTNFCGHALDVVFEVQSHPNDYAVEVASNAWFGSLVWPGAVGFVIGGPVGLAAGATVGGIGRI
jgi:hypothetical protein